MLQLDWSIVRLRPNSVSSGWIETQFDFTPQSPQPSQTSAVDDDALVGIGIEAALPPPPLLRRAGLVVDQDAEALRRSRSSSCTAASSERWWMVMPAGHAVPLGYLCGSSVTSAMRFAPSAATCRAILSTREVALDRLAAGHGDGVVVEDLVGDVDAGGRRGADRERCRNGCRCRRRDSGRRGRGVENGASPIQLAPSAAHLGEALGVAVHPQRHVVAADAGIGAASLRHDCVEVLCGQPEQKCGVRTPTSSVVASTACACSSCFSRAAISESSA